MEENSKPNPIILPSGGMLYTNGNKHWLCYQDGSTVEVMSSEPPGELCLFVDTDGDDACLSIPDALALFDATGLNTTADDLRAQLTAAQQTIDQLRNADTVRPEPMPVDGCDECSCGKCGRCR